MKTKARNNTAVAPSVEDRQAESSPENDTTPSSPSGSTDVYCDEESLANFPEDQCHYLQTLRSRQLNTSDKADYFLLEHIISGHSFACEPIPVSELDVTLECPLREEVPFRYDKSLIPTSLREPLLSHCHIRLIEVCAEAADEHACGSVVDESTLCCRTYQACLDDLTTDGQPMFAALSYVCGDQTPVEHISCESEVVGISHNVYQALSALRFGDRPRLIWVDCLCIDQNNEIERNRQVGLLHKIYAQAHVVSWLGNGNNADIQSLSFYLHLVARLWTRMVRKPEHKDKCRYEILASAAVVELKSYIHNHGHESFQTFTRDMHSQVFEAEYFSRLWTIQEIILAKTNTCQLGTAIIPLAVVNAATQVIQYWRDILPSLNPRQRFLLGTTDALNLYLEPAIHRKWRLRDLKSDMNTVMQTSWKKCPDPRDHVYGLTSLFRNPDEYPVDYSLSVPEVFADFVAHCLRQGGLDAITIHRPTVISRLLLSLGFRSDVPSWCTDVMQARRYVCRQLKDLQYSHPKLGWHASNSCVSSFARLSRSTIVLRGIAVSRVRACSDILEFVPGKLAIWFPESKGASTWSNLLDYPLDASRKVMLIDLMKQVLFPDSTDLYSPKPQCSEEMHSLMAQVNPSDYLRDLYLPIYLARVDPELFTIAGIEIDLRIPRRDYGAIIDAVSQSLHFQSLGTRSFATEDNQLGSSVPETQVGDLLCIIYGASFPQILRAVEGTGNYLLIGECHVPGLMYGEGLELGLPEQEFTVI